MVLKDDFHLKEERMHTDEYEISLAREINHCQQVVNKIERAVEKNHKRYGMDCTAAAQAVTEGRLTMTPKEMTGWQEDVEALPGWQQRLKEYREALSVMRISASRF